MYLTALHKFIFSGKVMPGLVGNFANKFNNYRRRSVRNHGKCHSQNTSIR